MLLVSVSASAANVVSERKPSLAAEEEEKNDQLEWQREAEESRTGTRQANRIQYRPGVVEEEQWKGW